MAEPTSTKKALISVFSALIFFIVASPWMYGVTSSILGSTIAVNGCPSLTGLILHTVVFGIIVFATMFVQWEQFFLPIESQIPYV